MAADVNSRMGSSTFTRDIGVNDDLKRSRRSHQSSRKGKERLLSPRGTETIKYPDKLKAENHQAFSLIHQNGERRQDTKARAVQQKAFESRLGQSVKENPGEDELIKHMSNLPAYLHRIEKGENFQEKVLNVGVLDWTRLEKWSNNQKDDVKKDVIASSSSTSLPTFSIKASKDHPNTLSGLFHKDDHCHVPKPTNSRFMRSQDGADGPNIYMDYDRKRAPASSSLGRKCTQVTVHEREKRKELSPGIDLNLVKPFATGSRAMKSCKVDVQKKVQQETNHLEPGASSFSMLRRWGEQVGHFDGGTREKVAKAQDVVAYRQPQHSKQKSTAVLLKRFPQSSIPYMLKKNERMMPSPPCSADLNRSSFSDSFASGDLHSGVILSEIPTSCPLPSQAETQSESVSPSSEKTTDALSTSPVDELQCPWSSEIAKRHGSSSEAANTGLATEPEAHRSRNSSPNRRFSFGLGRMTRSFSFKETTSIPKLGPTYISSKSGPVTNHDSSRGDNSNEEKANSSTRSRSSPLRRLLEPLLKSKSMSSRRAADNVQPPKPPNPTRPLLHVKHEKSTVQALLQLTVKNGSPLFKFVVDNSSDVLAATVSSSMSAHKNGSFKTCTFYSVNEIKKKVISWIGQGSKAKGGSFAYNVVGHMKLSNSPLPGRTLKSLNEQIITTECILLSNGDSRGAGNKQLLDSNTNRELAAIVFKFSANETGDPNSVTVILPGGIHGLPDQGKPSPLIERWVSGGSCDCGGWDVGCKLHVLSNKNCSRKNANPLKTCSTSENLELFAQMEAQSDKRVFSLRPFRKGIYSIEFDSSVSLLQAFSICVSFLSCQRPPDLPEGNFFSEVNTLQDPALCRTGPLKSPMIFQRAGLANYTPCPPLSPVGRV